MVNLTSHRPGLDTTVVLRPGDHSFVTKETVVYYAGARLAKVDAIPPAIEHGLATYHDDVSLDVLHWIQDGLLESPETPRDIKKYYQGHS